MVRAIPKIVELLRPPSRFMRSVHLDRDFYDPNALDDYVVTPAMATAFRRMAEGLATGSGRRAWRITGDYGVGKSSFALVLAQLLSDRTGSGAGRIADAIGWEPRSDGQGPLWPVLVTGTRERMVGAIARGIGECLQRRRQAGARAAKGWSAMVAEAAAVERSGEPEALMALVASMRAWAAAAGAGVLLIVDEMGKLLEHAARDAGGSDVFILQRLAELAARSGNEPFLFVGLLHQGFQAYAERLPTTVRHEWDKVAGRFEEIVFDQPLAHTAALVAGALGVQASHLHSSIIAAARKAAAATGTMGWLGGGTSTAAALDAAVLYPIHPTLLPLLVRFFARYGQHERSLFGFLLSSEPFGLQAFAAREAAPDAWYGLPEFYDYVRAVFGHRLSGGSYQSHWLRITAAVEAATELSEVQLGLFKAVAMLNLLDADDLPPTDRALAACLDLGGAGKAEAAAAELVDRGLLFRRGAAGGYRLWPSTSVNLHSAFQAAERAVGQLGSVGAHLAPQLPREPILARRHYVERGTMRYFAVRHAAAGQLGEAAAATGDADGLILVILTDTAAERAASLELAAAAPISQRGDLVVGVSQPLARIEPELRDLRCWQWVAENTPELTHDAYAAAEVSRQIAAAREAVGRALDTCSGLRSRLPEGMAWYHGGRLLEVRAAGLSSAISDVCDRLYPDAPRVANELLNRNVLSSAAAAARMRLIEGIFDAPERPFLGIDPVRAPPEKSMYLSVMLKGGLHRETDGEHRLAMPAADDDPLNLSPALREVERLLQGGLSSRVGVPTILKALAGKPFGVRAGVAPLLLALVMKVRAHELAVYENGTFRPSFGGQDAMRLIKAPQTFEIQLCRIEGVRAEAFRRLAETFAVSHQARQPEILDVVQPLCQFAARLPEYTRRAGALSRRSAAVRDVLLSASEPTTMLFKDLPLACGVEPFGSTEETDDGRSKDFVVFLQEAIEELRADYPRLLGRIMSTAWEAMGGGEGFDRAALAARAARVSLTASQPRLRTFALRLRDPGTSDDAWAEALASYIASKPPSRWNASDEGRCFEELATLADLFRKVEAAAFGLDWLVPDRAAVRINLTRADGEDHVCIIESRACDVVHQKYLEAMEEMLPSDRQMRMRVLMDLLWEEMSAPASTKASRATSSKRMGGSEAP